MRRAKRLERLVRGSDADGEHREPAVRLAEPTTLPQRVERAYHDGGVGYVAKRSIERGGLQQLRRRLPGVYWWLASTYYRRAYTREIDEYTAPLDPFKIEYVDPERIVRSSMREYPAWKGKRRLFGTVRGGDWDRPRPNHKGIADGPNASWGEDALFENKGTYRMFEERFVHGVDWEETDLIQQRLERARRGEEAWQGCTSPEAVLEQCRFFDDLYEEMRTDGFLTQRELRERDPGRHDGFLDLMGEEVLVDVGRTGELLHVAGDHRTSLAKLLGLDAIPVAFLVRHPEWMEYRDRLYEEGSIPNHPDLRDLR
jgi:hypothetical protein